MKQIELVRKVLSEIKGGEFNCHFYAIERGVPSENLCYSERLYISAEDIRYLIKKRFNNDVLFEGLKVGFCDMEEEIKEIIPEDAWPQAGPRARVHYIVPMEHEELLNDLYGLNEEDDDAVEEMRERVKMVCDGDYTFGFDIVDGTGDYEVAIDLEKKINLSRKEVLGLLKGECNASKVFDGICDEAFDEELIEAKAEDLGFASKYNRYCYGGESQTLEHCVNAWLNIIESIFDGDVSEDNVDYWLKYFDDPDNFYGDLYEWHENKEEERMDDLLYFGKYMRRFESYLDNFDYENFKNLMFVLEPLPLLKLRDGYLLDGFACGSEYGWVVRLYCCKKNATASFDAEGNDAYNDSLKVTEIVSYSDAEKIPSALSYFDVPFTKYGIMQAWLFDNAYEFMIRKWHAWYGAKFIIYDENRIEELFPVDYCGGRGFHAMLKQERLIMRNDVIALDVEELLPKISMSGNNDAVVEYVYWNDWSGLVKAKVKAHKNGNSIVFDEPETETLIEYSSRITL